MKLYIPRNEHTSSNKYSNIRYCLNAHYMECIISYFTNFTADFHNHYKIQQMSMFWNSLS